MRLKYVDNFSNFSKKLFENLDPRLEQEVRDKFELIKVGLIDAPDHISISNDSSIPFFHNEEPYAFSLLMDKKFPGSISSINAVIKNGAFLMNFFIKDSKKLGIDGLLITFNTESPVITIAISERVTVESQYGHGSYTKSSPMIISTHGWPTQLSIQHENQIRAFPMFNFLVEKLKDLDEVRKINAEQKRLAVEKLNQLTQYSDLGYAIDEDSVNFQMNVLHISNFYGEDSSKVVGPSFHARYSRKRSKANDNDHPDSKMIDLTLSLGHHFLQAEGKMIKFKETNDWLKNLEVGVLRAAEVYDFTKRSKNGYVLSRGQITKAKQTQSDMNISPNSNWYDPVNHKEIPKWNLPAAQAILLPEFEPYRMAGYTPESSIRQIKNNTLILVQRKKPGNKIDFVMNSGSIRGNPGEWSGSNPKDMGRMDVNKVTLDTFRKALSYVSSTYDITSGNLYKN